MDNKNFKQIKGLQLSAFILNLLLSLFSLVSFIFVIIFTDVFPTGMIIFYITIISIPLSKIICTIIGMVNCHKKSLVKNYGLIIYLLAINCSLMLVALNLSVILVYIYIYLITYLVLPMILIILESIAINKLNTIQSQLLQQARQIIKNSSNAAPDLSVSQTKIEEQPTVIIEKNEEIKTNVECNYLDEKVKIFKDKSCNGGQELLVNKYFSYNLIPYLFRSGVLSLNQFGQGSNNELEAKKALKNAIITVFNHSGVEVPKQYQELDLHYFEDADKKLLIIVMPLDRADETECNMVGCFTDGKINHFYTSESYQNGKYFKLCEPTQNTHRAYIYDSNTIREFKDAVFKLNKEGNKNEV